MSADRNAFLAGLEQLGITLSERQLEQLDSYARLLTEWQQRINLIGPSTLPEIYRRHILDAAQLAPFVSRGTLLDIGAGAGIPSVILAVMTSTQITAAERIAKKTSFVKAAAREMGVTERLSVFTGDVRSIEKKFDIITARAVASLNDILTLAYPLAADGALYIFPKGGSVEEEIFEASKNWVMTIEEQKSITSIDGKILLLRDVQRK